MDRSAELFSQGVSLSPSWGSMSQRLFTEIEQIGPEMIDEATADACRAVS